MILLTTPLLAEAGKKAFEPLFGNQWLALLAILVGVTIFLFVVAAVGRWLAATHPDEPARPTTPASVEVAAISATPSAEIFAAIAAAVAVTLGSKARITSVSPGSSDPAIDPTRQQWSMEGRRQIYSSHKVR